jgi:hypothetical protein
MRAKLTDFLRRFCHRVGSIFNENSRPPSDRTPGDRTVNFRRSRGPQSFVQKENRTPPTWPRVTVPPGDRTLNFRRSRGPQRPAGKTLLIEIPG